MNALRRLAPLLVLVCVAVRADTDSQLSVRELRSPAGPGSGQQNLALTPDGRVLLSWVEPAGNERHSLRYATRSKGGGSWSEPSTIAEGSGWFVNWADFPSLAAFPDGTLFAHWLARSGPGTYAYDVRVSASPDGRKWSSPIVPHRDGTHTEHGFVSMTPASAKEVDIVWLDGRKTAGASGGHGGKHGEMSLVHTTVGSDGRLGAETVLDGRVCECCQTDMARAGGATLVVYRDRSEKEIRDLSIVRLVDGRWSAPRPVAQDGWELNGCPVNGPAIAAAGGEVAVAWFTAAAGKPRVNVAFSSDSGASFGGPIGVDDGRPLGRVDVVFAAPRSTLVSWLERTDKGVELRVRTLRSDGTRGDALTVANSSAARSSGFPRMVQANGEVVVAWRDVAEPPSVRTAVLTLGGAER